ncbi:DUF5615 family PIN-like protein [Candidatus Bipolaricaulota bacterium]|nr:DUF5615 family PIN-like protein [Candidatus Bipolaricaulota bacterium]
MSFGDTRLKRALQEQGHYVVHVGDARLAERSDTSITQAALSSGAAVVTSDGTFVKTALSQGGVCPGLTIVVPQLKKGAGASATLASLAGLVGREVRSTAAPGSRTLAVVRMSQEGFLVYRWHIPNEIVEIWRLFEARGEAGVPCEDLACHWRCAVSTAWRRAERHVRDGWLRKLRRGRRVFYAQSWVLKACLAGTAGVAITTPKEQESYSVPQGEAQASRK